ncbi:Predicted dehydrogenase [Paenibacillus uliginis N3/975]|uniref:Predicted dehydrogenase n=1 Tax=Paenibacillus uliginis N3/975 TaxID=1313296 RepID=A0A1X7HNG5_9BACL|nr:MULTISPECIES: Gfo/Idh/MocA family oxidoreductase [Paenibacillus]UNK19799.1 Gfo/Idh/MocA family oxidoreductase [Paenibacillus sp. N3/727]SMF89349.1 Predicted dehydrogenase [Paenibacillus uliginis N3/975]
MKKKRVGIIGCGNIFPMHAVSVQLSGLAEVVAVSDVKEDRAKNAAKKYNCDYYLDYNQMIKEADLDVVHVCTPHYLHAPMVIAAAEAGKHVLTEKPMSITVEEAQQMIKACEDNNVTFGVIFQNRWNPGSQLIKTELESGRLGRILGARCSVTWKRSDEYYSKSDWKGTWDKEGGGVIIDQAIHTLDQMRWFINDEIKYVSANIENRTHELIDVEDSAEGVIAFNNGVLASFYAINYHSYDAPVEVELHCENGFARVYSDKGTVLYNNGTTLSADKDESLSIDYGEGVKNYWGVSHSKQIKDFYEELENGVKVTVDGHEALKTQKLVAAIYESGKSKQRVYF